MLAVLILMFLAAIPVNAEKDNNSKEKATKEEQGVTYLKNQSIEELEDQLLDISLKQLGLIMEDGVMREMTGDEVAAFLSEEKKYQQKFGRSKQESILLSKGLKFNSKTGDVERLTEDEIINSLLPFEKKKFKNKKFLKMIEGNVAGLTYREYKILKEFKKPGRDVIKIHIKGISSTFVWINAYLLTVDQPLLFCLPKKVPLNVNNYISIVENQMLNHEKNGTSDEDISVTMTLFIALLNLFPCKK